MIVQAIHGLLEWLGAAANILTAGAACIGVYIATRWRGEQLTRRKVDLAEEVLTLAYQIPEAVDYIRTPMLVGEEIREAAAERLPWESDSELQDRLPYTANALRYSHRAELFSSLHALGYRAGAAFGQEHKKAIMNSLALPKNIVAAEQEALETANQQNQMTTPDGRPLRSMRLKGTACDSRRNWTG